MATKSWELDLVAEWNSETGDIVLRCPRSTRRRLDAVEERRIEEAKVVDFDQLLAELKSAAEEDST